MPCCSRLRAEIVLAADPDEVARNGRRVEPGRNEGVADALSLGELPGEVVARVAKRGCGDAGGRRGDRRGRSPRLQHRGRCRSRNRVPDAERGVAEGLRHRAQHDQVGALVEPWDDGLAAVLDVGLVDHDRCLGVAPRELDELGRRGHDARRVVRVAAPDEACAVGAVSAGDGIRAREHRRDAVQRVGRRDDRRRSPRLQEGAGAQQDEIVGARADDDLVRRHLGAALAGDVRRRGLAELAVGPVGIRVEGREALRQRDLRNAGQRRRVLVELQDLGRGKAVPGCDLRHRGSPRVGGEAVRERDRDRTSARSGTCVGVGPLRAHARSSRRSAAAAWSGRPSARAIGPITPAAAAAPASVARTICSGFMNISSPSPPEERARPPVGRTCVAPAA